MKRFALLFVSALLVLAPMSASALEQMSDASMKDVTGQAGVSIAIDDVVIYQESIADTTYWDTDGLTGHNVASGSLASNTIGIADGGVMIDYDDASQRLILIDAIETYAVADDKGYTVADLAATFTDLTEDVGFASDEDIAGFMDPTTGNIVNPADGTYTDGYVTGASPLTIDIGSCEILTAGLQDNNSTLAGMGAQIAGVIIGLPTIEIEQYHTTDYRTISVVSNDAAALNNGKALIAIEKTGTSKMAILGGVLEIAPH